MIAFISALLAGIVALALGLTETVTNGWLLFAIGLGSWIAIYIVLKFLVGLARGQSPGKAATGIFEGIGDTFDGASCGSGGCGSGGGD